MKVKVKARVEPWAIKEIEIISGFVNNFSLEKHVGFHRNRTPTSPKKAKVIFDHEK